MVLAYSKVKKVFAFFVCKLHTKNANTYFTPLYLAGVGVVQQESLQFFRQPAGFKPTKGGPLLGSDDNATNRNALSFSTFQSRVEEKVRPGSGEGVLISTPTCVHIVANMRQWFNVRTFYHSTQSDHMVLMHSASCTYHIGQLCEEAVGNYG